MFVAVRGGVVEFVAVRPDPSVSSALLLERPYVAKNDPRPGNEDDRH